MVTSSSTSSLSSENSFFSGKSGKKATAAIAEAGALVAASWASSWDRDLLWSALSSSSQLQSLKSDGLENSLQKFVKTSATIEDFRFEENKSNGSSNCKMEASPEEESVIVVSSQGEDQPPLWTLVNNSAPMNAAAVNVITGTRITHGHPLMIG